VKRTHSSNGLNELGCNDPPTHHPRRTSSSSSSSSSSRPRLRREQREGVPAGRSRTKSWPGNDPQTGIWGRVGEGWQGTRSGDHEGAIGCAGGAGRWIPAARLRRRHSWRGPAPAPRPRSGSAGPAAPLPPRPRGSVGGSGGGRGKTQNQRTTTNDDQLSNSAYIVRAGHGCFLYIKLD
jgi:hypothetical protein